MKNQLKFNNGKLRIMLVGDPHENPNISTDREKAIIEDYYELQLNAVNMEAMKDAQINPDKHRQLVVRIWGWSAYFVELDKEYQDHVMRRQEYTL